ncbi:MAG: LLM class flavin-dependent oxidoreductase [Rhodospirillaceae bacterium]|jgi:probable F420-dependent oxidoreductase|nr:LLM class flavin-dependent oxidoreductase [Rhodospirillaceae bacterium]MBT5082653.1 LLM class flavin-dependent oxidoreductase [Rhodospirillaceae bacterium]MBT5524183.1 LLM class flavin-dependent oxidoreductase [Rhodospirillaceae bacterium]MBT5879744.1 LLM class flavin-dependent oxidoreductase [Rhodospirillaceae bacterium]MBT6589446.1 LLM class flavin-dependent oxidoreductase [Rhodospirillaceae bacterium]
MTANNIRFGTALRSPYNVAQLSRQIEDLGYDVLGCGEHVSFYGDTANGFVSLSVAAGATQHIQLMSTITLVPLYPAALLAKMGAALDVASGGRYSLGVGVGGEFANEFAACGVPINERGARTDDALEVITRTWTATDVTYDGRFTKLENFSLKPLPIQKPRPPIWVSGRSDAAMRRAAKYADGWLPYMYTPEQLADSITKIRAYGEDLGRDMSDFTFGMYVFTAINEDNDLGVKYAADRLSVQYSQDFSQLVHKFALAGDPDHCQARLQEYVDAGASLVFVSSACPDDYIDRNLQMISSDLIPNFRA